MERFRIIDMVMRLKMFSAGLSFACLFLLTSANFFLFPFCDPVQIEVFADLDDTEKVPLSPEEKSTSNSLNVLEEYVHDSDHGNNDLSSITRPDPSIIAASRLYKMHFELISPPPDTRL